MYDRGATYHKHLADVLVWKRLSFYNHFSDKLVCVWVVGRRDNLMIRLQNYLSFVALLLLLFLFLLFLFLQYQVNFI